MTVVINGNTYEVIDGGYHLVATYGLACEISGMDPGSSIDPNELIPKGHISDAGCKIVDNDFHPLPYSQRTPEEQLDKV